jgi:phosphoribosylformylglycinamidine cyclo-ligase
MGSYRYSITDPFEAQPVFEFVQQEGEVTDEEMHRTFNMGTGFVAAVPEADAEEIVGDSEDARVVGEVADGDEAVAVRGLELTE